jgi:hypothetical protein
MLSKFRYGLGIIFVTTAVDHLLSHSSPLRRSADGHAGCSTPVRVGCHADATVRANPVIKCTASISLGQVTVEAGLPLLESPAKVGCVPWGQVSIATSHEMW